MIDRQRRDVDRIVRISRLRVAELLEYLEAHGVLLEIWHGPYKVDKVAVPVDVLPVLSLSNA